MKQLQGNLTSMTDRPIIITDRKKRPVQKDFLFTENMVRLPDNEALKQFRLEAWKQYLNQPFPDTTLEAWRRTNIRKLQPQSFHLAIENLDDYKIISETDPDIDSSQVSGQLNISLSEVAIYLSKEVTEKGVIFTDLKTAEKEHPQLLAQYIGKTVAPGESKFAALSEAMAQNGIFVYIPDDVILERPLSARIWCQGHDEDAFFFHTIICLGKNSSITYIQELSSPQEQEGKLFHAGVVETSLSESSNLRFVEMQSLGKNFWNFSHKRVNLGQDANLEWIVGELGSRLTKTFYDINLNDRGSKAQASGFYFVDEAQHLDLDTQQNHFAVDTTSDLAFSGILAGKSRAVWQGMVYVAPEAIRSDGYQTNRNLVLSDDARIDSIPGLEILTDDVKCSHGATVGKIDSEQLFYLLSRGIPKNEAQQLIVEGFINPILDRIPSVIIREQFHTLISNKIASAFQ